MPADAPEYEMPTGPLPEDVSWEQKYAPAMRATTEKEAQAYLELCIQHSVASGQLSREQAEALERENIAYWAGYCDHKTRLRVERLYQVTHPVFGPASDGPVTFAQAMALGERFAAQRQGHREH